MRRLAFVFVLAGCDKLIGLSPPTYVPPDAPMQQVTGEYRYSLAAVGSDGHPVLVELSPPADTKLDASLLDGTTIAVMHADDGTFTFAVPIGSTYRFTIRDSDQTSALELQSSSPTMALRRALYSRPDAKLPTMVTDVSYSEVPQISGGTSEIGYLASTGVRSFQEAGGPANGAIDWTRTGVGLVSAQAHDRLIYEHIQQTNGVSTIVEMDSPSDIEMTDGGTTMLGVAGAPHTPQKVTADRCAHLYVPAATELALLNNVANMNIGPAVNWDVFSIPLPTISPSGGALPLALSTMPVSTDMTIDVTYGSPYIGEVDAAALQVTSHRMLILPGSAPFPLEDSIFAWALVPACSGNMVQFGAGQIALLETASLDGSQLTTDTQGFALDRTQLARFDYALTSGAADTVVVTLYEVLGIGESPTFTAIVPVRAYVAASPVWIDPTLLVRGHHYLFGVQTRTGVPNAPQLDFRTVTFPNATATLFTTMFRIAN